MIIECLALLSISGLYEDTYVSTKIENISDYKNDDGVARYLKKEIFRQGKFVSQIIGKIYKNLQKKKK